MTIRRDAALKSALIVLIAAALPMAGSTLFLDTGGTDLNPSNFGNIRQFNVGGITVTVTAWGTTANSDTAFQTAHSGQYSGLGLGICNQAEGLSCGDPNHQVDNAGQNDFLLIMFSSPVNLSSVVIHPYCGNNCPSGGWDRDLTYFDGFNIPSNVDLTNHTITTLPAGFLAGTTINNTAGTGALTVNLAGNSVNALLIGTADPKPDSYVDRFKLQSITFNATSSVPEPGTMAMLGGALAALGLLGRRKWNR